MEMHAIHTPQEFATGDDDGFTTLQAQLALRGVELHRVTNDIGREAYSVNVRGQLRTLDHLPHVVAYAKCMGVVVS